MSEKLVGTVFNQAGDAAGASFVNSESDKRVVNNDVRHQYRVLSEEEKAAMLWIKDQALTMMEFIDARVPAGREVSLAKTKIEEAVMWSIKGLTK